MGDAADDARDAAEREYWKNEDMRAAGCRPCPLDHELLGPGGCPVCHDLGWLDAAGNPCEP